MRKVYRDLYANLPVTGLRVGDLGYATDREIFYSWSGAAWETLTIYIGYGLAADIPDAADLPDGCLYQETDTAKLMEVQAGAWVCIFYSGSGTETNIPAVADIPEGALYYETDTAKLKQVQSGSWVTIVDPSSYGYGSLSVAGFQLNPATGTASNPQNLNNNNTGSAAGFDVIDEYAQVDFLEVVYITQFRQYGHISNNGNGTWTIQYQDVNGAWHDWVTGIATRGASWSGWDSSGAAVPARAIKVICTAVDTGIADSALAELEVNGEAV